MSLMRGFGVIIFVSFMLCSCSGKRYEEFRFSKEQDLTERLAIALRSYDQDLYIKIIEKHIDFQTFRVVEVNQDKAEILAEVPLGVDPRKYRDGDFTIMREEKIIGFAKGMKICDQGIYLKIKTIGDLPTPVSVVGDQVIIY